MPRVKKSTVKSTSKVHTDSTGRPTGMESKVGKKRVVSSEGAVAKRSAQFLLKRKSQIKN